ncbi:MAG: type II secretion system F family protein [Candidatus Bathyarchaeota archaeon]|nr:type II secretion system F family protein [Candidatus Bathyarchaeota archaeon]MDH5787925.1 type II secretion system F family protein [Candidatus Bathyarchaeota archaeon]
MPKIEKRAKEIAWAAAVSIAITIILFAYLMFFGTAMFDEFVFFALIVAVFPPGVLSYVDYRWRKAVDGHLPDLFRSIVQAQDTGMTLTQSLEEASKRDYGPLTAELKKITAQISWGMSFEEALLALGRRVNTTLVQRTVPMMIETSRSGGHVERVFDPMGKFIQTTLLLEKERRAQTRPYIAIIYVAFFVFLFTIILLFKSFFVSVEGLPILGEAAMTPQEIQRMFFHMTAIQAFFDGIVAGKMGEGTISAGLKHSLIMMICGYLSLKLFL